MPKNAVNLEEIFYRQKGLCYWCRCPMYLDGIGPRSATREHLIPQAHGGKKFVKKDRKLVRNIVAACRQCNSERGTIDADAFRKLKRPNKMEG
jgi:hypothetical protein